MVPASGSEYTRRRSCSVATAPGADAPPVEADNASASADHNMVGGGFFLYETERDSRRIKYYNSKISHDSPEMDSVRSVFMSFFGQGLKCA